MPADGRIKIELGGSPPWFSSRPDGAIPGEISSLMNDALADFKLHYFHRMQPDSVWLVVEREERLLEQSLTTRREMINFLEGEPRLRDRASATLGHLRRLPQSKDLLPWVAVVKNPATGGYRIGFGRFFLGPLKATA